MDKDKSPRPPNVFKHNPIYDDPEDQFWYEYHKDGSAIKIQKTKRSWSRSAKQIDSRRGKITTFSRRARNRLLWLCASLDQSSLEHKPLFLSLTYPSEVIYVKKKKKMDKGIVNTPGRVAIGLGDEPDVDIIKVGDITKEIYKRHIKAFRAVLMRKYPNAFAIVRIEHMDRKSGTQKGVIVCHLHIAVFNVRFIDFRWVNKVWNRITTFGKDKMHLERGASVESAKDWGAVASYFSKTLAYVAKEADKKVEKKVREQNKWVGQHYAVWNKEEMQKHIKRVNGRLTDKEFYKIRRQLYQLYRAMRRKKLIKGLESLEVVEDGEVRGTTNVLPDNLLPPIDPRLKRLQDRVKVKRKKELKQEQFNRQMVGFKKWKDARTFLGGSLMGFIPDDLFVRMLMNVGVDLEWDEKVPDEELPEMRVDTDVDVDDDTNDWWRLDGWEEVKSNEDK